MDPTMLLENRPGAYIIECLASSACYAGGTDAIKQRLMDHIAKLRAGRHDLPLLQADWQTFGAEQFVFWIRYSSAAEINHLEREACLILNGLEEYGGYNKSLVRARGLSSRIRDSERKYRRRRRFCPINANSEHQRLNPDYIRTFCQGNTPLMREAAVELEVDSDQRERLRQNLLSGFQRLDSGLFERKGAGKQ